ncbi:hypothetical protein M0813_22395 [Anaeramoeba flamelloides]|uniref:EF-hand domain-containing protein n=1 Tax=Anaeramoeba flamelloides TaxID=1746091 RepID=A0ABQ8YFD7_9EUKA|nr:hypothetical protein M0813_22395 [Anaeramoeba flamelloides]
MSILPSLIETRQQLGLNDHLANFFLAHLEKGKGKLFLSIFQTLERINSLEETQKMEWLFDRWDRDAAGALSTYEIVEKFVSSYELFFCKQVCSRYLKKQELQTQPNLFRLERNSPDFFLEIIQELSHESLQYVKNISLFTDLELASQSIETDSFSRSQFVQLFGKKQANSFQKLFTDLFKYLTQTLWSLLELRPEDKKKLCTLNANLIKKLDSDRTRNQTLSKNEITTKTNVKDVNNLNSDFGSGNGNEKVSVNVNENEKAKEILQEEEKDLEKSSRKTTIAKFVKNEMKNNFQRETKQTTPPNNSKVKTVSQKGNDGSLIKNQKSMGFNLRNFEKKIQFTINSLENKENQRIEFKKIVIFESDWNINLSLENDSSFSIFLEFLGKLNSEKDTKQIAYSVSIECSWGERISALMNFEKNLQKGFFLNEENELKSKQKNDLLSITIILSKPPTLVKLKPSQRIKDQKESVLHHFDDENENENENENKDQKLMKFQRIDLNWEAFIPVFWPKITNLSTKCVEFFNKKWFIQLEYLQDNQLTLILALSKQNGNTTEPLIINSKFTVSALNGGNDDDNENNNDLEKTAYLSSCYDQTGYCLLIAIPIDMSLFNKSGFNLKFQVFKTPRVMVSNRNKIKLNLPSFWNYTQKLHSNIFTMFNREWLLRFEVSTKNNKKWLQIWIQMDPRKLQTKNNTFSGVTVESIFKIKNEKEHSVPLQFEREEELNGIDNFLRLDHLPRDYKGFTLKARFLKSPTLRKGGLRSWFSWIPNFWDNFTELNTAIFQYLNKNWIIQFQIVDNWVTISLCIDQSSSISEFEKIDVKIKYIVHKTMTKNFNYTFLQSGVFLTNEKIIAVKDLPKKGFNFKLEFKK